MDKLEKPPINMSATSKLQNLKTHLIGPHFQWYFHGIPSQDERLKLQKKRQPRSFTKKSGDSDMLQQEVEEHMNSYIFTHFPRKNTGEKQFSFGEM